jgi:hypothetical protein
MPALNFMPQFVERIEIGLRDPEDARAKTHTIRAPRKDGRDPKVGDTLYLYTGLRQKGARRIGVATCTRVESIVIGLVENTIGSGIEQFKGQVWTGPAIPILDHITVSLTISSPARYQLSLLTLLTPEEVELFAIRDGFAGFAEMMAFWRGRLPFVGYIIHWRPSAAGRGKRK